VWPPSLHENPETSTPVFERPVSVTAKAFSQRWKNAQNLVFSTLSVAEFCWFVRFAFIVLPTAWGKGTFSRDYDKTGYSNLTYLANRSTFAESAM